MSRLPLPVIVGFGGFNAAGRSSFHHSYRRMVLDSLPQPLANETVTGLAALTRLVSSQNGRYVATDGAELSAEQVASRYKQQVLDNTLIRRIEPQCFHVDAVLQQKILGLQQVAGQPIVFEALSKELPEPLPANWHVEDLGHKRVRVSINDEVTVKIDSYRVMPVQSAGQLPSGFDPAIQYNSRFHPRGIQLSVVAASDAIYSLGMEWSHIVAQVQPDQIGVYAASALGQLDEFSYSGLLQGRMKGGRATSKQLAMGFSSLPADFINAYVLGSVGVTGAVVGACATFLYNLQKGIEDIQSGRRKVVIVGSGEAPITPEIIEGFNAMSALASDDNLRVLDGNDEVNYRRASRPFGDNCGFVIGESAQYVVLMDDELALNLGADIYAAVPNVFVNADGFKKSISAPGPGNYLTLAKSVGAARSIVGDEIVKRHSFIQAHGSSTPQNRVTESHIFDQVAKAFSIEHWPVAAVKAYLGHSLGPASGDQLAATLGVFKYGFIPGIKTIDAVAEDVHAQRLLISNKDQRIDGAGAQVAFLNSKGFGGNNASATVLSPQLTESMLEKRFGRNAFKDYCQRRETVRETAMNYEQRALQGDLRTIYNFGQNMIDENQLSIDTERLSIPGFEQSVSLNQKNPYQDMV